MNLTLKILKILFPEKNIKVFAGDIAAPPRKDTIAGRPDRKLGYNLSQFFTEKETWLKPHIKSFILRHSQGGVLDPYAGDRHILESMESIGVEDVTGMDIDSHFCPPNTLNDSLKFIIGSKHIIVTNPPYKAKNSAVREKNAFYKYFKDNKHEDIYQVALEKCLQEHAYCVAIIPETFILSTFPKERLHSITVIEENPFTDTDCPVCVVCFDDKKKTEDKIKIYKNKKYIMNLAALNSLKMIPKKDVKIKFNVKNGNVGLRGIDSNAPGGDMSFCLVEDLGYDVSKIKHSSRAITVLRMDVDEKDLPKLITKANIILRKYRKKTYDLLMASFKGNRKDGVRRRRIDFSTVRAILEQSLQS